MAKINSYNTYGLFTPAGVTMSAVTGSSKTATVSFTLSGSAPATLLVNIPADSIGEHILTFKSADGRADVSVQLDVGELNVIRLDSKSIKKPDGTADFTISTTAASVSAISATACVVCHAAVKNN